MTEDFVGEGEADVGQVRKPEFDGEEVIVTGGFEVFKGALDDGKNGILFLKAQEGKADVAVEFATGGFQEIKVTAVIDVVSEGAVRIGDAKIEEKGICHFVFHGNGVC